MSDEIADLKDQIRECVKTTDENAKAITGLIAVSAQQSKDTDRLVNHIDKLIPMHEKLLSILERVESLENENKEGIRPRTLKALLIWGAISIIGYGIWATNYIFYLDKDLSSHKSSQEEKENTDAKEHKDILEKTNKNQNQITYLKGRIK